MAPSPGFPCTRRRPSLSPLTQCVLALPAGRHCTSTSRSVVRPRARDWGTAKTDNGDKCVPAESKLLPGSPHGTAGPSVACHEMAWCFIKSGGKKGPGRQRCDHALGLPPTTPPRRHMLRRDALTTGFITSLSLLYQGDRQRRPSPLPRFPTSWLSSYAAPGNI